MRQHNLDELVITGDGNSKMTADTIEDGTAWGMFEREDDWCATAFFYLNKPTTNLPAIDDYEARVKDLTG